MLTLSAAIPAALGPLTFALGAFLCLLPSRLPPNADAAEAATLAILWAFRMGCGVFLCWSALAYLSI